MFVAGNPVNQPSPGAALLIQGASAAAGAALAHYTDTRWCVLLGAGIVWNLLVNVPPVSPLAAVGGFAVYKWLT
jgi:hypothetical protein